MKSLIINKNLLIGHSAIDAEHQQIADLIGECANTLVVDKACYCLEKYQAIYQYVIQHYDNEEKIMAELGYPNLANHQKQHNNDTQNFNKLVSDYAAHKICSNKCVHTIKMIKDIFIDDMITADMDFKSYLQEIRYKD